MAKIPVLQRFTKEQMIEILSNNSTREACRLLNLKSISNYRKLYGLKTTHNYSDAARRFHLNHDFFENIDTEEKAYILGFIAADGNVNPSKYSCEIRIVLHPKDLDILEKINSAWESTYSIRDHKLGQYSGYPGSCKLQKKLSIASLKMQTDLAKYGIVPNKTAILRYPKIPDYLDRHFLRGFLDGDGYINHEAFGWTSNSDMSNDIQWICLKHGFKELRKYYIKSTSTIIRGTPIHLDVVKWMYEGSTIFLNRKHFEFVKHWKFRIYRKPCRKFYPSVKHIPCALEALPPGQGSMPKSLNLRPIPRSLGC